jgi:hypothetical protein
VASFYAFTPTFSGGVRVAVDDVNGDGVLDIICAAGPGGGPQVEVIDGTKLSQVQANGQISNSAVIISFFAFNSNFTGGVYVAAGNSSNGQNWVVVGAGAGGGPQVGVYTAQSLATAGAAGTAPTALGNFFPFNSNFTGGVTVAVGDITGSGNLDVITAAGPGGGPQVVVVDGTKLSQVQANGQILNSAMRASYFAFNPNFMGGSYVSAGATGGAGGQVNLILGVGPGVGPQVLVVNGSQLTQLQPNFQISSSAVLGSFYGLASSFQGGVRVGFVETFGNSADPAILTAAGPGGGPEVAPFDAVTFQALGAFFAPFGGFAGGLFVAG